MRRRDLLRALAGTGPMIVSGRVWAAPQADTRLLVVFLRGAYDAANVVVPVSSDFYYAARPSLAIPKTATLALDSDWGLHPALKDSIYPLWQSKQIAFVPFAGTAYVLGAVKKPGNIVVKENLTVSQAVALAGDIDPMLANYDITIMRFDDQGKPISIHTNLTRILALTEPDIPIKDHDVVMANENTIKKALWYFKNIIPVSGGYSVGAAF